MGDPWSDFPTTDLAAWTRRVDASDASAVDLQTEAEPGLRFAPVYGPAPGAVAVARPTGHCVVAQAYRASDPDLNRKLALDRTLGLQAAWLEGGAVERIDSTSGETWSFGDDATVGVRSGSSRWWLADGVPWHDAGATAAQELGIVLASMLTRLREAPDPVDVLGGGVVRVGLGGDVFLDVAKLRALRWLCRAIASHRGGPPDPVWIVGHSGWRNRTAEDIDTNLVRGTLEATAAVLGGVDELVLAPHTDGVVEPTDDDRRWALGVQHLLRDEAGLVAGEDPLAGSGFVDAGTRTIAREAWAFAGHIREAGGPEACRRSGWLARRIDDAAARRQAAFDRCERGIVGVTLYPPEVGETGSHHAPSPTRAGDAGSVASRGAAPFEDARRRIAGRSEPLGVLGIPGGQAVLARAHRCAAALGLEVTRVRIDDPGSVPRVVWVVGPEGEPWEPGAGEVARLRERGAAWVWSSAGGGWPDADREVDVRVLGLCEALLGIGE